MPKKWRIIDLINWAEIYFKNKKINNPRFEIEWLIRFVLKINRIDVYLNFDKILSQNELRLLKNLINRRINKEPLQYIINSSNFYGREFFVNEDVLIPRLETEILIDLAKKNLKEIKHPKILDIGTGSGCIGITLALEISGSMIVGIDISKKAIDIANINKKRNNLNNISFFEMDILHQIVNDKFDCIISNPPYISKEELPNIMKDVKDFEPLIALTDKKDGLVFYKRFSKIAEQLLKKNGKMIFEVGLGSHPNKVQNIFFKKGFSNVTLHKDLNGDDRVLVI